MPPAFIHTYFKNIYLNWLFTRSAGYNITPCIIRLKDLGIINKFDITLTDSHWVTKVTISHEDNIAEYIHIYNLCIYLKWYIHISNLSSCGLKCFSCYNEFILVGSKDAFFLSDFKAKKLSYVNKRHECWSFMNDYYLNVHLLFWALSDSEHYLDLWQMLLHSRLSWL